MSNWLTEAGPAEGQKKVLRYVARQPILDRSGDTFGYELLFRDSWENRFRGESETASQTVIDTAITYGLEDLVDGAVPFVNCTRSVILGALPMILPRSTVLELLETVEVDQDLILACQRLRAEGFRLALDDFDFHERWEAILEYADYIKVDFRSSQPAKRRELLARLKHRDVRFIAEKVETTGEFETALKEGFHFFQGYFFMRPVVLGRPALSEITGKIRLLDELRRPELNFPQMASLLREEPSLAYRVLRLSNSAAMGRRKPVTSIEAALAFVGEDQFRRLATGALTAELCAKQPREAQGSVLRTARFCELMSVAIRQQEPSMLYLFGFISSLHQLLNLSLETVSTTVNFDSEMLDALSGTENVYKQLLRCLSSFEVGDWSRFREAAGRLGCSEDEAWGHASSAQRWADGILATAF